MTETEAADRLSSMVAAESAPTLTLVEVDDLLRGARRADGDGYEIADVGWTPTWDLNAAAAEGWRRKAGKVAGEFTFNADGGSFNRAEQYRACLDMAKSYSRGVGSYSYATAATAYEQIGNL